MVRDLKYDVSTDDETFLITTVADRNYHYDGAYKYVLILFGVRRNGNKCMMLLTGIRPYFDIKMDESDSKFMNKLNRINNGSYSNVDKKIIKRIPFNEYTSTSKTYVRFIFDSTSERTKCLNHVHENTKLETASNELVYYRMAIRDHDIKPSSWYRYDRCKKIHCLTKLVNTSVCDDICVLTPSNLIENTDPLLLQHVPILEMAWDIETHSDVRGSVPSHNNPKDVIFMISCSLYWVSNLKPIINFVLSTVQAIDDKHSNDIVIIKYDTECDLIKGFLKLLSKYLPEVIVGFNDSAYDWPFIFAKIDQYGLESLFNKLHPLRYERTAKWPSHSDVDSDDDDERNTYTYYVPPISKIVKIKLDDGMCECTVPNVQNILPLDMRTHCRRTVISDESSLDYYLSYYKLPLKVDLSHGRMHDLYNLAIDSNITSEKDYDDLRLMYEYSSIDSRRCHDLMHKLNVYMNLAEMSNLTLLKTFDTFCYAGSLKVHCLILHMGNGIYAFDTRVSKNLKTGKYSGAHVVSPIPKLYNSWNDFPPVSVDVNSLYPSVMITFNISPDTHVATDDMAKIDYDPDKYAPERFDCEDKTIYLMRYKDTKYMGLIPKTLLELLNKRNEFKRELKKYQNIPDSEFMRKYYDAKQLAVKILANTIYGTLGSSGSFLCNIILAIAVTSYGQIVLHKIINHLTDMDMNIIYGDTDSVFFNRIKLPDYVSDYRNKLIDINKLTELKVNDAINDTKSRIVPSINEMLKNFTGSSYINVVLERSLFPLFMCSKKNYAGIPHENEINKMALSSNDKIDYLVIKGIQFKKRGTVPRTYRICAELLNDMFQITDHNRTPHEIIISSIQNLIKTPISSLEEIVQMGKYNPIKVSYITKFVELNNLTDKIKPGDRVKYFVSTVRSYTLRGNKASCNIYERMREYTDSGSCDDIDIDYYNESIFAVYAKFLFGQPEYSTHTSVKSIKDMLIKKYKVCAIDSSKKTEQKRNFDKYLKPKLLDPFIVDCKNEIDLLKCLEKYLRKITKNENDYLPDSYKVYIEENRVELLNRIKSLNELDLKNVSKELIDILNEPYLKLKNNDECRSIIKYGMKRYFKSMLLSKKITI